MRTIALFLVSIFLLPCLSFGQLPKGEKVESRAEYAIVIHGGAGTIKRENMTPEKDREYREMLTKVLQTGEELLKEGKSAIDVVEACIHIMEDSPLFNAGKGAVFTNEGKNELDASIMDGKTMNAGAVAGIGTVRHPISAARAVMEHSPHVMLSGKGAEAFAKEQKLELVSPAWFQTDKRKEQLKRAKEKEKKPANGDQGMVGEENDYKFGTVGVAVLDKAGNIAAGTSTGGMTNKRWGRIGDSPVIGAGTYANNATCAISCTGHGEFFIRYAVAHDISALMEYKGFSIKEAAEEVVMKKLVAAGGSGGIIGLDAQGNVAMTFNSEGMYRGYLKAGEKPVVAIYGDE
jgi:beta-aspartyl-peptidase (threonine type)